MDQTGDESIATKFKRVKLALFVKVRHVFFLWTDEITLGIIVISTACIIIIDPSNVIPAYLHKCTCTTYYGHCNACSLCWAIFGITLITVLQCHSVCLCVVSRA